MCKDCGSEHITFGTYITTCRVCELVDRDTTEKGCALCKECGQYICQKCWGNKPRRAIAAMLHCASGIGDKIISIFK